MPRLILVIQWPNFGPYHLARLESAHDLLSKHQFRVVGLEIASRESNYPWQEFAHRTEFERQVLFTQHSFEELSPFQLFYRIKVFMDRLNPTVVAVNGYGSIDSISIIIWAWFKKRPVILFSDSKEDDSPRNFGKEYVKRFIVSRCKSALCAGGQHRDYLIKLGMAEERIFLGYDVVDNHYYMQKSQEVLDNPDRFRSLPGLETSTPFFLASARFMPRKNLEGLLRAYQRYRELISGENKLATWRLVILGDGEERSRLEGIIEGEKIVGVTLAGFRQIEDLPAYYALASAFIHPALQDQWGLVVNEAMACGLPVIVSKQSGCSPELVKDGVNGFVYDARDTQGLSKLMYRFCTGDYDLNSFGQASREIISLWGTDCFAEGLYSAITCALG